MSDTLREMAEGLEMAAYAEGFVVAGLEPDAKLFHDGDRSPTTMRRLRVYNEAKANMRRFTAEAATIRRHLAALQFYADADEYRVAFYDDGDGRWDRTNGKINDDEGAIARAVLEGK